MLMDTYYLIMQLDGEIFLNNQWNSKIDVLWKVNAEAYGYAWPYAFTGSLHRQAHLCVHVAYSAGSHPGPPYFGCSALGAWSYRLRRIHWTWSYFGAYDTFDTLLLGTFIAIARCLPHRHVESAAFAYCILIRSRRFALLSHSGRWSKKERLHTYMCACVSE